MPFTKRTRVLVAGFAALLGAAVAQTVATAFFVNEQPISDRDLTRARQNHPLSGLGLKGAMGQDVENLILDQTVLIAAAHQDAASIEVDSGVFADFVEKFRTDRELGNDEDYLKFLDDLGFTEGEFLEAVEKQLQLNKRIDEITASAVASDAELEFYYTLYQDKYLEPGKPAFPFVDLKPSVRKRLETDVGALKQNAELEVWVAQLMWDVQVRFPEGSTTDWYNPVIASVNGLEIRLSELNREVYNNPLVMLSLQNLDANRAKLIRTTFKPKALEDLIDRSVARQYANHSGKPYVGTGQDVLEQARRDQRRNVRVSDAEVRAYYLNHKAAYTDPASATMTGASFKSLKDANAFRSDLLRAKGTNFFKLAARYRGTANEYGKLRPRNLTGPHTVLLDAKKLTRVGNLYVSPVIREDSKIEVFLVADLKPASLKPFEAVRAKVASLALEQARGKVETAWWVAERKRHLIVNNLERVQQELEARAKTRP